MTLSENQIGTFPDARGSFFNPIAHAAKATTAVPCAVFIRGSDVVVRQQEQNSADPDPVRSAAPDCDHFLHFMAPNRRRSYRLCARPTRTAAENGPVGKIV
jgi:hypothetical protein